MSEQRKSRLFCYELLEPREEIDEARLSLGRRESGHAVIIECRQGMQLLKRLEKCHSELSSLTSHLQENEVYNHLNDKVSRSAQDHEDITNALFYSILTDPATAPKTYHTLTLVSRDSLALLTAHMERIIMEKIRKLQDTTRIQVLWLTREMIQTGVAGADKLCFALLKQLPAGSTNSGDIYIIETLMHILLDNREWLEGQPALVSSVVYTYLSLLPDHMSPSLASLRKQEAQLCVSLIRNRFLDCAQIGRDLVRLLQGVARIPEITELWRDMIQQPQKLSPQFTGLQYLLTRRTSRRFIAGRVLPDAEIKLNFLLSKVKFGMHRRYQEWFQKKYLSTPESHHQIPELIRFVCCVIHPPNEVLGSDIIPRWALVGWLLSLCQPNPVAFSNAKLALFYDWLGYNPETDNIMNIEPATLLMHHSLRSHPQITATLLDFLCRLVPSYCPGEEQFIEVGVKAALRDVLHKGVLLSMEPLFESPKLDDVLRALVRQTFPEFYPQVSRPVPEPQSQLHPPAETPLSLGSVESEDMGTVDNPLVIASEEELQGEDDEVTSAFSDHEEDAGGNSLRLSTDSQGFVAVVEEEGVVSEDSRGSSSVDDPWKRVGELPKSLAEKLLELKNESDPVLQPKLLEELLNLAEEIMTKDAENGTILSLLAPTLADCLTDDFSTGCMCESDMQNRDEERLTHCMFRHAIAGSSSATTSLIVAMHQYQSRLGYFLLHYLHTVGRSSEPSDVTGGGLSYYQDFASGVELDLKSCLIRDMRLQREKRAGILSLVVIADTARKVLHQECVECEPNVFYSLLPAVYKQFPKVLVGSDELLNLTVAHIDPTQLHSLILQLMMKQFQMFGKQPDPIQHIIGESLHWDSFEQFCVWQLISAESPDCQLVIPALANLNPEEHPEALSSALLFLKTEVSNYGGVGAILSLPSQHCALVDAVCGRWISTRPSKYATLIAQFLENVEKGNSGRDSIGVLKTAFNHLQRLSRIFKVSQMFEASESVLSKTLVKLFSGHPELSSKYGELHKKAQPYVSQPGKKETKKAVNPGDKSSKFEPKTKRRRVVNKEELTDS